MKRKLSLFIMLMCTIAFISVPVFAEDTSEDVLFEKSTPENIFRGNLINQVSNMEAMNSNSLNVDKTTNGEFEVDEDNMEVALPESAEDEISIKDNESNVELKIKVESGTFNTPKVIDESIVYEDEKEKSLLGVDVFDGGIRQTFILKNADSGKRFTVSYDAKDIAYMNYAYNEHGKTDGSVLIYNNDGDIIAAIEAPWAKDNNGNNVKTYYEINGTKLTQVLEPNENNVYPIIADPYTYSSYFYSSKWIYRKGASYPRSLSINPKIRACGLARAYASWSYLYKKHKSSKYWKNISGMKDQYVCHAVFPQTLKTPWNIEPGRPDRSFVVTVAKPCNP